MAETLPRPDTVTVCDGRVVKFERFAFVQDEEVTLRLERRGDRMLFVYPTGRHGRAHIGTLKDIVLYFRDDLQERFVTLFTLEKATIENIRASCPEKVEIVFTGTEPRPRRKK